ncbi:MAG: helix-turn-helix transcriptional regulator [Thermomicrobia bacterium]|nr:helix-turn-helix transcriptional regulator [Thermomicrobia bacterium]
MEAQETETPFIAWLRALLRTQGWSGNYLGEQLGLSGQTVHRWLHGTGRPTRENVIALSGVTGVPEDDITALLIPDRERQRSLASYLAGALPEDMTRHEARFLVYVARAYREWARDIEAGEPGGNGATGGRNAATG